MNRVTRVAVRFSRKSKFRSRSGASRFYGVYVWCVHGARANDSGSKTRLLYYAVECQRATMISPFVSSFIFTINPRTILQLFASYLTLCSTTCYYFNMQTYFLIVDARCIVFFEIVCFSEEATRTLIEKIQTNIDNNRDKIRIEIKFM